MGKFRKTLLALAVSCGVVLSVVLGAAPAQASGFGYDGTYPGACATGSVVAASYPILTSGGVSVGTEEVRYSPSCGTNWVRAYTTLSGYSMDKIITRTSSPYYQTTPEFDPSPGWSYSPQVYAPGSTCIVAQVYMYPAGGGPFYGSSTHAVC